MLNVIETAPNRGWRGIHGLIFLALMGLMGLNRALGNWPWFWLAPLAGYCALASLIPPLRRSFVWPRVGTINLRTCAVTGAIIVVSCVTLVAYQIVVQPDLTSLRTSLPIRALGGVFLAGVIFPLLNATVEELVFRGVLYDAVESEWGWRAAIGATAVLFGLGHLHGYPPGWLGACLAGIYGVLLGLLRAKTGGLLLPIIAHVAADATIYGILVRAGTV